MSRQGGDPGTSGQGPLAPAEVKGSPCIWGNMALGGKSGVQGCSVEVHRLCTAQP